MVNDWQELTKLTGDEEIVVKKVGLISTEIEINGDFELPPLAKLSADEQIFVAVFVRCHGSITQMEKFFGISYPTVKNRLNKISASLDFVEIKPTLDRSDILDRIETGEISVDEALKMMEKRRTVMSDERIRILNMVAEGKITTEEAERLLDALSRDQNGGMVVSNETKAAKPKFLRILVEPKNGHIDEGRHGERVNIKVPIMLIKAGMKLGSMLPNGHKEKVSNHLRDKGINIDLGNLDSHAIDELLMGLKETSIDVDDETETVKIFCE
ncbi:MAG: DUF2089 domain-containing protein [Candidatus Zixiibacteriota bacterium]